MEDAETPAASALSDSAATQNQADGPVAVREPADAPADGLVHSLDPRWVPYQRRVAAVHAVVYAALLTGAGLFAVVAIELPTVPVVVAAVVILVAGTWSSMWWPDVEYRYASYRLDPHALEIRRGVLWRSVIDVPRSRIQHSDVSQGPFERMHGLGTLSVYTAGTRYAQVRLHGLSHERALAIREHLLQADGDDIV